MQKYAALISYLGTNYCGWQRQGDASGPLPSIEETLSKALSQILNHEVTLVGSGRTDAGVHASGQVAHFESKHANVPEWNLARGWNTLLPPDIRVLSVKKVAPDFHAQHGAKKKQYSYYVQAHAISSLAHLNQTTLHHPYPLALEPIQNAMRTLIGTHDFKVFQAAGSKPGPTERTIFECDATWVSPGAPGFAPQASTKLLRMRFVGSGFLKQMIRSIVGTLIPMGENSRSAADMKYLLTSLDRSKVGATALPHGLWLEWVQYEGLDFERPMEGQKS